MRYTKKYIKMFVFVGNQKIGKYKVTIHKVTITE